MKKVTYVALTVVTLCVITMFASKASVVNANISKITSFEGKLANDFMIEMIYVPSTQKLGVVLKNKKGEYVEGYMLKDVKSADNLLGKHDLSSAKKYGKGNYLGKSFIVKSINEKSTTVQIENQKQPVSLPVTVETSSQLAAAGWCTRLCEPTTKDYDWWACFNVA